MALKAGALIFFAIAFPYRVASAPTPPPLTTPHEISAYVREVQHEYELSDTFYETLKYESWGFQNIQSTLPNPSGPNGRENSWGVCQINLNPSGHPEVTREEAMNPRWCVQWAAQRFAQGHADEWTGYQLVTSRAALAAFRAH